ncbi:hypothetical protein EEL31_08835 [Brevibacillus laterosporus]|uniref:Phage protein n=1 Tax=Brevibacillus laterosporus TaxID=1465 RepID=A0A518VBG7_BRELA|nr:hypothetical protein [Brevibacillus laterosporus]QDX94338.1 hypothetical protein EEL30_19860 [Brevibacillus laterosporus]TPG68615.1 hypothetical protein EEL31_08835 [Brevibacillus laterosporus]
MAKYRKKPVIIDAEQLTVEMCQKNAGLPNPFRVGHRTRYINYHTDCAVIETLEGKMRAEIGDWIITGIKGEKYPCKPDIFEATYELVE